LHSRPRRFVVACRNVRLHAAREWAACVAVVRCALPGWRNGIRRGLKILGPQGRVGSTPTPGIDTIHVRIERHPRTGCSRSCRRGTFPSCTVVLTILAVAGIAAVACCAPSDLALRALRGGVDAFLAKDVADIRGAAWRHHGAGRRGRGPRVAARRRRMFWHWLPVRLLAGPAHRAVTDAVAVASCTPCTRSSGWCRGARLPPHHI
jgi:hypothetical protein